MLTVKWYIFRTTVEIKAPCVHDSIDDGDERFRDDAVTVTHVAFESGLSLSNPDPQGCWDRWYWWTGVQ